MKRLVALFILTTLVGAVTSILLGLAVINEAARSSEYSQQSYRNGQRDAELFIRGQIVKAQIEQEIIQEAQARIAEEKL